MTTFAWVIDQTSCIGCHACTTACKAENDVPLGVNRTWVKYVESGTFPATRRDIAVLRCNHCAKPPCVEVCPTSAMVKRPDGIVDFDTDRCIGCKACIQACPYDAIYIDPEEHVAEKCNFCAHRVDRGLLPACVVVCPTESLVFGDLADPDSRAARLVATRETRVRRPEQGTGPQAYYLGASEAALDPLMPIHTGQYMWAERRTGGAKDHTAEVASSIRRPLPVLASGVRAAAAPRAAGSAPVAGAQPAAVQSAPARVAYDVFHPRPWGWKVALYLWTKGIGAGAFALVFLAASLGVASVDRELRLAAAFISLLGVGLTTLLLVADLKRPERFLTILFRPQRRSWLALGAFILVGYSGLLGLWFLGTFADVDAGLLTALGWPTVVLAAAAALYTALLLRQCEARDLWQQPATIAVLAAQAAILGAAAVLAVLAPAGGPARLAEVAAATLAAGAAVHLVALVGGELLTDHPTPNGRAATHVLTRGAWAPNFWLGGVLLAGVAPLVVSIAWLATGGSADPGPLAAAGGAAALGVLWYELGFVAAGQAVPIS